MTGKAKPRELAKQETRAALIQAGMAAFSEEGVDLPSLDAICARAGFTRGAFYVHFKDREDFFAAVVEKALQDFVDWMLSDAGTQGGLPRVIDRFIDVVRDNKVPVNDRHRLLMQLVAHGTKRGPDAEQPYKPLIEQAISRLSESARQGLADGTVQRDLEATQLALMLVASAIGFIAVCEGGYVPDFEKIRTFMHRLLLAPRS